jgi:hypothetical protein
MTAVFPDEGFADLLQTQWCPKTKSKVTVNKAKAGWKKAGAYTRPLLSST